MDEEILDEYYRHLCGKYRSKQTRNNYHKFVSLFLRWLSVEKNKTYKDLKPEDTQDYKMFCLDHYKINGNVGRLNAINNFVEYLEKPNLRLTVQNLCKSIN